MQVNQTRNDAPRDSEIYHTSIYSSKHGASESYLLVTHHCIVFVNVVPYAETANVEIREINI